MGHHDSYDIAPNLPIFGGTKSKSTKSNAGDNQTLTEAFASAAVAIAGALKEPANVTTELSQNALVKFSLVQVYKLNI